MIVVIIRHLTESKFTQKFQIYNCNTALKHKNVKTESLPILPSVKTTVLFTKLPNISRRLY